MNRPGGRAVLYHRVSTRDQHPAAARAELRRAALLRGLKVAHLVEETGSGARNDRPGLARVLELARRREITHLLVWKLDRLGRSVIDTLSNVRELRACGVTLVSVTQSIQLGPDRGDAHAEMMLVLWTALAELEREQLSERTRLGLEAAVRRGSKLGRPVKRPDLVQVVKELRYVGASWREIARALEVKDWEARRAARR